MVGTDFALGTKVPFDPRPHDCAQDFRDPTGNPDRAAFSQSSST